MENRIVELLVDELHDLLSAEEQIVKALPKVIASVKSPELKAAYKNHLAETKNQIKRLNQAFKLLDMKPMKKFCKGAHGLIQECEELLKDHPTKSFFRDAAMIAKTQRIEHYEMAGYGSARTYAKEAGLKDVMKLLQETLNEEGNADKALTKIAVGGLLTTGLNVKANQSVEPKKKKAAKPKAAKPKTAEKAKKPAPKKTAKKA